jgi:hypothetical protein
MRVTGADVTTQDPNKSQMQAPSYPQEQRDRTCQNRAQAMPTFIDLHRETEEKARQPKKAHLYMQRGTRDTPNSMGAERQRS